MYCGDASTSGNHLIRRIKSVCGEPRDRNRWNVYCRVPLQQFLFILRKAILLLHTFVRQNVHPLTAATFGDWLSPGAQARYHKSRINTIGLNADSCLITAMVESRLQY